MRKKLLTAFLCVSMAAGIVTGCGAKAEETVTGNTGVSEAGASQEEQAQGDQAGKENTGEAITLEVLSLKTEEGPQAAFTQIFDNYTAANPNITFEIQTMSSYDLKTTLRARSLSNLSVPYMSLIALFAETVYGPNPDWSAQRDAGERTIAGDEGWKKAFDILTDVVYQYGDPDTAYNQSYEDCAALIANGEAAFCGNGSWALSGIRDVNPDANIGLMAFPVSDNPEDAKLLCFPDTSLSICAASEHVDAARDFLSYVASEEAGKIWSENVKVSSAVTGVNVDYDPSAADVDSYLSSGQFTPYGDHVLRSVFTDKLWETFSYYMLGGSN